MTYYAYYLVVYIGHDNTYMLPVDVPVKYIVICNHDFYIEYNIPVSTDSYIISYTHNMHCTPKRYY